MLDHLNHALESAADAHEVDHDVARALVSDFLRGVAASSPFDNQRFTGMANLLATGDEGITTPLPDESADEVLDNRPKPGDGVKEKKPRKAKE